MKVIQNLRKNKRSGFTLLEILLVVAAIGILAGIVIFAINPTKQLADVRNAQRRIDVNTILNAVTQFKVDNRGNLPGADSAHPISTVEYHICPTVLSEQSNCGDNMVDLTDLTAEQKYIIAIPFDPSVNVEEEFTYGAGYNIFVNSANGRITVTAPLAENEAVIAVTN